VCVMQEGRNITIKVKLSGFNSTTTQKHGMHVHQIGRLDDNCKGAGGHYNPANMTHGGPTDSVR